MTTPRETPRDTGLLMDQANAATMGAHLGNTPQDRARAARTVHRYATCAEDAALLLAALGLDGRSPRLRRKVHR